MGPPSISSQAVAIWVPLPCLPVAPRVHWFGRAKVSVAAGTQGQRRAMEPPAMVRTLASHRSKKYESYGNGWRLYALCCSPMMMRFSKGSCAFRGQMEAKGSLLQDSQASSPA